MRAPRKIDTLLQNSQFCMAAAPGDAAIAARNASNAAQNSSNLVPMCAFGGSANEPHPEAQSNYELPKNKPDASCGQPDVSRFVYVCIVRFWAARKF